MVEVCSLSFYESVKDLMTKQEADELFDRLENIAKQKQRTDKATKADALQAALYEMQEVIDRDAAVKKFKAYRAAITSKDIDSFTGRFNNQVDAIETLLVGNHADISESRYASTELKQKQSIATEFNAFATKLYQEGVYNTFTDKSQSQDIAKAIFKAGTSGNANAEKVAKIYNEHLEVSRKRQNNLGADIGDVGSYIAHQTHNPEKLLETADTMVERLKIRLRATRRNIGNYPAAREIMNNMAFERWKNYIMPRLDFNKTFNGVNPSDYTKFLRGAWEGLVTGRHLTLNEDDTNAVDIFKYKGYKGFTARLAGQRKLHFKDGVSWLEYADKYGNGTLQQAMVGTLRTGASTIAMLEKWGPNPRAMFDAKLRDAMDSYSRMDSADKQSTGKIQKRLQSYFDMLDGTAYIPTSFLGAKIGAALRSWQAYAKLGGVVISSFPDLALRAEMFREMGGNMLGEYANSITDMMAGRPKGEMKIIADSLGVWAESQFGHLAAYMAPFNTPYGMLTKTAGLYSKLTGLEWWDETNRLAIGTSLSRMMAMEKKKSYSQLDPRYTRFLKMYGINESEWDLMRANENIWKSYEGKQFITPDAAFYYSPESIANYLGKPLEDVKAREITEVQQEMHDRLMSFFIDRTNDASLRPGIQATYTFTRGTKPGTLWGEVARCAAQFKHYPVEFMRRVVGRKFFGIKMDGQHGLRSSEPDVAGLINLIIGTTILGYVSMNTKNILKNRTLRSPTDPGSIIASLLQGGGLGIYGDFIFGQYNRFGQSMIESLVGPVPVSLEQGAKILFAVEHLQDPTNQTIQFMKNNMPFINIFYLRTGLDFLLFNGLQNELAPGSLQRYQQQIQTQNNQQYLIDPLTLSPWAK